MRKSFVKTCKEEDAYHFAAAFNESSHPRVPELVYAG